MSIMDTISQAVVRPEEIKPPKSVAERIKRGRNRMKEGTPLRNECLSFWRGDQYVYRNKDNYLVKQGTLSGEAGKPNHRVRLTRNLFTEVVEHEVSASTKRVPSYEIDASTTDPEDIGAARLAEKVALFGYTQWRVLDAIQRVVTLAIVADEGFAWPYFDNQIGRPLGVDDTGALVAEGDIRIRVFNGNEVYWEPGVRFDDSRWHAIEQARPIDEVKALPGFFGGELNKDATNQEVLGKTTEASMVLVTEYLERPSLANPAGQRIIMANNRIICPPEQYPCLDGDGQPVDEPVLHKLSRILDPASDRDLGLVRFGLDAQRTHNDCTNKESEFKNLALVPQILAPVGSIKVRPTDEPGQIIYYVPVGNQVPQWRPTPQIPPELARMKQEAEQYINGLFSQNDIPDGVDAAKALQVLVERDDNTREGFTTRLADFHSRLMRHCLYLVQRHYSEPRLLKIRGRFGPESIEDFRGVDLRSQCDVRVFPGSIEPRTKQAMEQRIMTWAQLGWVGGERAMAAIENGTAEALIESYELDVARANKIIRLLKAGPEAYMSVPPRTDETGQQVPGWMPRPYDNADVWIGVIGDWLKTDDADGQPADVQEAANLIYEGLLQMKQQKAMEAAAQQNAQAESLGSQNAAKPQIAAKPNPSLPAVPS